MFKIMMEVMWDGIKDLSIKAFNLISGFCLLELMIWTFGIFIIGYMIF